MCYVNPRQRPNATKYSRLLSELRDKYKDLKEFEKNLSTALKETAVTAISATDKPNVRPPKGSFKPHFNVGYDDWIERKKEDHPDYKDLPRDETSKIFKDVIETYKKSFNAADQESEDNKNEPKEHTIKYAGGITFYHNKKKFFGMGIRRNLKGEYIWMEAYKNTKHKQMPVSFSSSNIFFDHGGKLEITDIENKIIKGNHGYIEWMFATFDPNDVSISENFIEFIIKYSMEGLKQRIDGDESFITNDVMKKHMNNFKNKRRDSNDFKNAVKVIGDFYNPKNIKTIDR